MHLPFCKCYGGFEKCTKVNEKNCNWGLEPMWARSCRHAVHHEIAVTVFFIFYVIWKDEPSPSALNRQPGFIVLWNVREHSEHRSCRQEPAASGRIQKSFPSSTAASALDEKLNETTKSFLQGSHIRLESVSWSRQHHHVAENRHRHGNHLRFHVLIFSFRLFPTFITAWKWSDWFPGVCGN